MATALITRQDVMAVSPILVDEEEKSEEERLPHTQSSTHQGVLMKKTALINVALLLAATTLVPSIAIGASVNLSVKGVIKPTACSANLASGGALEYGEISYNKLKKDKINHLEEKEITLNISCDSPTLVGIRTTDNRSATKPALENVSDLPVMYGLGTAGNTKLGAFYLLITDVRSGADSLVLLEKGNDANSSWTKNTDGVVAAGKAVSWGARGATTVGAYKSLSAKLAITPLLNKASLLPANEIIRLDGSATIEILYL